MTDRCKNITLPQTLLSGGKNANITNMLAFCKKDKKIIPSWHEGSYVTHTSCVNGRLGLVWDALLTE